MSRPIDSINTYPPSSDLFSIVEEVEALKKNSVIQTDTLALSSKEYTNPEKEIFAPALTSRPFLESPQIKFFDMQTFLDEFASFSKISSPQTITAASKGDLTVEEEQTDTSSVITAQSYEEKTPSKDPLKMDRPALDLSFLKRFDKTRKMTSTAMSQSEQTPEHKSEDVMLLKLMVKLFTIQKELEEQFSIFLFDEIKLHEVQQQLIKENHFNLKDDIHHRQKVSDFFGWVNLGLTCGLIASSLAICLTGGVSVVFATATSTLGLLQGGTLISKALIDHKNDKKIAELYSLGADQKHVHAMIQEGIEATSESMKLISWTMKTLNEIVRKRHEAVQFYS